MVVQPRPELIALFPAHKFVVADFLAWATQTPELAGSPVLSALRFHSVAVDTSPKEYAILLCKPLLSTTERTPDQLWILMDMHGVHGSFPAAVRSGRVNLDNILVSTNLHCLLDPCLELECIEVLNYDQNDTEPSSPARRLSLRHIADMYNCAMRFLPEDVMVDFSWLCHALFECLDRCETCFRSSGRQDLAPTKRVWVDMSSVAYTAVQYIDENHVGCCKPNYFPRTPLKGEQFLTESDSFCWGPPLFTNWVFNQGSRKRPYTFEEELCARLSDLPAIPTGSDPSQKRPRMDEDEDGDEDSRAVPGLHNELPTPVPSPVPERRAIVINSAMSASEIVTALGYYGCKNLGNKLDPHSCGEHPMCNGGLGDIYKGELDGLKVAIKTTRMYIMNNDEKYLKHAAKELYTWSKCKHPNVLRLLGLVEFRGQIGMLSEWMNNGDIRKYLNTRPEVDRCHLCYRISDGLAYLHSVKIIHGDLKGANILMSDDGTPMLTDFGNAVLLEHSLQFTESVTRSNISPRWTAPEILSGSATSSYPADVYALGMTWLEVITGKVPFHELQRDTALYHPIVNERKIPQRPSEYIPERSKDGDAFWSLLVKCWAYTPEERPSSAEARDLVQRITWSGLTYAPDPIS